MRKSDDSPKAQSPAEKTFGQAFGDLIRQKRGQEGLTQKELAVRAFDDESKVRRIIELESGSVSRPHVKTIDPLVVYFNISETELDKCRNFGLFTTSECQQINLSRELIENLALRFECDNPDADDSVLLALLKTKADELRRLKERLAKLEGNTEALDNQIKAANAALEVGEFVEADDILAAAEEIQQEERTLKEIRLQADIRFARGDAALFRGDSEIAHDHYVKAADYFLGFDRQSSARILDTAAHQIYEIERRTPIPTLRYAIDLIEKSLVLTSLDATPHQWVLRKYRLALLQLTAARHQRSPSLDLLGNAIANALEAIEHTPTDLDEFDKASVMGLCSSSPSERLSRRWDHASVRGQH